MCGAYFDGTNTWPLSVTEMVFDYETRNLTIDIEGDQEMYSPGDTVTVTTDVIRTENGEPVPEENWVLIPGEEALQLLVAAFASRLHGPVQASSSDIHPASLCGH